MHTWTLVRNEATRFGSRVASMLKSDGDCRDCPVIAGPLLEGVVSSVTDLVKEGDALVSRSQYTAAAAAYGRALEADPGEPYIYTKRATAYAASGQSKLALRDYSKALELKPATLSTLVNRGKLYLQLCQLRSAHDDFTTALAAKEDHREATAALQQAQDLEFKLQQALEFEGQRNYAQAEQSLAAIWLVARDCIPACLIAARMFLDTGRLEEAVAETGRIIKQEPDNVDALLLRGRAFFGMEDFDLAKRHFGEVIRNYDPENREANDRFKAVKTLQSSMKKVESAVRERNWSRVLDIAMVVLPEVLASQVQLRGRLYQEMASARYHLKHETELILEAADAALAISFSEEMVGLKAKTLLRAQRFEAAVQLLSEAIERHGRTRKLLDLYRDAQQQLKISKQKDYYKVLGVDRDVDEKTLKKLYRKLALQYHPDKADGDKDLAEAKFAEINEAYEVLSDPEKRQLHDMGENPFGGGGDRGGGFGGFHGGFPGGFGGFSGGFGGASFRQGGRTFNIRFG